jgi:transcriptional regulator with XRE-family HTH domain
LTILKTYTSDVSPSESGLHRIYVGSVERKERNVTLSTLEAIALALDTTVLEILTEKDSDQN